MSVGVQAAPEKTVQSDGAGRRTRLRQYQVQLLERMQAARNNAGARINQLGVMIGSERFLLDLTQVGEIVPVPSVTVVPLTQPWYLGLANIRGNLISVIDLGRYQAQGETAIGSDSRVVTFAGHLGFNCGLLVSRVYGLRHAGDMTVNGDRLTDADANEWAPLDLAALVSDTRFLHVGF
ncbi:MAG: chemotaxis protein CheW [Pseudomonadota bacterium]